eukprot:2710372-Ditylum_brightwellii.AAC.1
MYGVVDVIGSNFCTIDHLLEAKEKTEVAKVLSQLNSETMKKYNNVDFDIDECVFLKSICVDNTGDGKKSVSANGSHGESVGTAHGKSLNKSMPVQEVMSYAEKYNEAILLMEDA